MIPPNDEPTGACGGGECVYDSGQWVLCDLHHREIVGAVKPERNEKRING